MIGNVWSWVSSAHFCCGNLKQRLLNTEMVWNVLLCAVVTSHIREICREKKEIKHITKLKTETLKKNKYLSQSTLKYWRFWSIANTLLYQHINNNAPSFLICLSILHKTPPLHCGFPFLDCYVHLKKRVPNYSKLRFFDRFTHINKAKT